MLKFLLMLFVAICFGCSEENDVMVIEVDKKSGAGNEDFLDIVTNIRIVPIETNNNVFIGSYDKLYVNDDNVYILDKTQRTIFIFDYDGKYVSKINKIGRASYEYMEIDDFVVNEEGDILLFDGTSQKVLQYSVKGDFIKTIKVCAGTLISLSPNNNIIIYGNIRTENVINIFNYEGRLLNEFFLSETLGPMLISNAGSVYDNSEMILFSNPFDYNIYTIENDTCRTYCKLDFLSDNFPSSFLDEKDLRVFHEKALSFKGVIYIRNLYYYKKWMMFYTSNGYQVFLNTKENKSVVFSNLELPLAPLVSQPLFANAKGMLYTNIKLTNIKNGLLPAIDQYYEKYPFLFDIEKENVIEDNNDWIFICHIKK